VTRVLIYCNGLVRADEGATNLRPNYAPSKLKELLASLEGKLAVELTLVNREWDWRRLVDWQLETSLKYAGDTLIYLDAFDCLFVGDTRELVAAFGERELVYCADKRCWPNEELMYDFPKTPYPWRYLSGSVMMGQGWAIHNALEWGMAYKPIKAPSKDQKYIMFQDNDQRLWTDIHLQGFGEIDSRCEIFQNIAWSEPKEFAVIGRRLVNTVTGTMPHFLHAAAKSWRHIPEEVL